MLNDEIEIITPNYSTLAKVKKIISPKNGEQDRANTNDEIYIEFEYADKKWEGEYSFALARTKGMKEL